MQAPQWMLLTYIWVFGSTSPFNTESDCDLVLEKLQFAKDEAAYYAILVSMVLVLWAICWRQPDLPRLVPLCLHLLLFYTLLLLLLLVGGGMGWWTGSWAEA